MNRILPVLPPLVLALSALAAPGDEFRGRLDPEVQPGTRSLSPVVPASPEVVALLASPPATGSRVWAFSRPLSIKGKEFRFAIVAAPDGVKTLWLDRNRDGRFAADESFPLGEPEKDVAIDLPWDNGIYRVFPLRLSYGVKAFPRRTGGVEAPAPAPVAPDPTYVASVVHNFNIVFSGSAAIDGRTLKLMFSPKPADTAIDPPNQRVSADADFNGRFDAEKGEAVNGSGRTPIFRVGERYLAVSRADVATGELVLQERTAADYTRFDALPGQLMPDFTFVDFQGRSRRLSDFRGKVVLLDFWGTWCGPCIEEMKHLDPLYERYAPRGFEVIGMNMERTGGRLTDAEYAEVDRKASSFIAKAGHKWIQATQRSIERFAQDVIQVNLYPTCILIGPDGRVLSRDARGEKLAELLGTRLPEKSR
ncbi:MAG: TlpA family protein disulfide reductase [Opitutaceae bacterium]|nr:TlpA family protein disulfide reductase [Opitutaceae bacterium]